MKTHPERKGGGGGGGGGGAGSKKALTQEQVKTTRAKCLHLQRSAVKILGPEKDLSPPHIRLVTETAAQHCLVFNLA